MEIKFNANTLDLIDGQVVKGKREVTAIVSRIKKNRKSYRIEFLTSEPVHKNRSIPDATIVYFRTDMSQEEAIERFKKNLEEKHYFPGWK